MREVSRAAGTHEVQDFARRHEVVQAVHDLLHGGVVVPL